MTDIVSLLATVPLLSGLDRRHLEKLSRDFSERTVAAGSVVVRQGDDHGIGFFVVVEGEGAIAVDGNEVGKVGPGSHFGEVALISDRVRTASVTATTEMRLLVMTLWDFRAFVRGDTDVSWKLLEHLAGMLHRRQ